MGVLILITLGAYIYTQKTKSIVVSRSSEIVQVPAVVSTDRVTDQVPKVVKKSIDIPDAQVETVATAMFGGGCFWCVESDLQKVKGVSTVVSGYAGGSGENPTYENYGAQGFREVVTVTYNPTIVSYANLVEHIIKHGDPTDPDGSFGDRGKEYAPAIYYKTEAEKLIAQTVIKNIDNAKVYPKALTIIVIPTVKFWSAEDYHQDYSEKNPVRYNFYRTASGRDAFIKKYWGNNAGDFTASGEKVTVNTSVTTNTNIKTMNTWELYIKPSDAVLRTLLTDIQYTVTQEEGTERSFKNEYDANKAEGIYVDVLSGEPLYSSKDKFDSGTGWPSFVKPITENSIVTKEDKGFFGTRIEVRSRYADSHLGHVFDDGPTDRGGKRYCMNSAAMRFIPKEKMESEGYGMFLSSL